ncbi:MAG: acetyl-CoA carboxylase biotin carboxyl carrier protein [Oscillospiraceae bacterium]
MNYIDIMKLMDKMKETKLTELCLEEDGFKLKLKAENQVVYAQSMPNIEPVSNSNECFARAEVKEEVKDNVLSGNVVKAPIVGTFYSSSAPDKPAFISVGSKVKKGDVLFIIESMKLMNEIQSEFDGTVTDILVNNSESVEYGQPIICIK